jgi:hypothetical protein
MGSSRSAVRIEVASVGLVLLNDSPYVSTSEPYEGL